ncbi:MAG: M4 family metallopeptidase [Candidatus Sedimenticola sp. (ex Thyasira tokunagai)]
MRISNQVLLSLAVLASVGINSASAAERIVLSTNSQTFNLETLTELTAPDSIVERKSYLNSDNSKTIRYQQMYHNIPIIGDDVIITRSSTGALMSAHGVFVSNIENAISSVTANISQQEALAIAKRYSTENAENISSEKFENETTKLAIWLNENSKAKLVFEVSYFINSVSPSRPYFIIDAMTGEILKQFNNLQTANATGPGGNQKTEQYEYGTDYGFIDVQQSGNTCTMENYNVKTVDLNHGRSGSSAFSFDCFRNTHQEINGAYSPLNDAHYFGNVVFDMYSDWLNIAPLDFQLSMRVHYSDSYENAFWNGSSMTFGDGANIFYPLVSLDVSAHEVSHGFTEQNSKLVYSGKSGGLNEAFSDMAGEAAEYYMSGTNDWMVGAQIFKENGALRYMDDPTKDGRSIGHQSDYSPGMDVHYSSGVYNKAFYLLANTNGWNTRKAFEVYAKANQQYWSANTDWDQAGVGVLDAACNLGYSVSEVQTSLAAVGITASPSNPDCGDTVPPIIELENGVSVDELSASQGNEINFIMTVPADATNINFNMSGGPLDRDADLYVRFGSKATDLDYDCRPYSSGNNESCTGTNNDGIYYVRIKAYQSFSGVSIIGSYNEGTPGDPINETITDISLSQGEWKYYTVDLKAEYANLNVTISGGNGDADIYLLQGAQPTTRSYDCRPYANGNEENCSVNDPAINIWHIGLRGYNASSGVTLNVMATPKKG